MAELERTQDDVIPVDRAQNARDRLQARGVNVRYQEFRMAHEIRPAVIELIKEFLASLV